MSRAYYNCCNKALACKANTATPTNTTWSGQERSATNTHIDTLYLREGIEILE